MDTPTGRGAVRLLACLRVVEEIKQSSSTETLECSTATKEFPLQPHGYRSVVSLPVV